jgi:hypothetical protein
MRGRPYKSYRDEVDTGNTEYRVIEKHLEDEQPAKEDSPDEDFLLSDTNKEIPSPKKEKMPQPSPTKEHHVMYKKPEEPIIYKKQEDPVKSEKLLKDLIEDKEPNYTGHRNKFEHVMHVQGTSFHIPTKQSENKDVISSNSGFTIGTHKINQQPEKTKPSITTTKQTKKEEPVPQTMPQMPYMYPYPMFFYPPNYDPNNQVSQNTPTMTPHPMMYYMPPQYMQQPEKDVDSRKPFGPFPTLSVLYSLTI